MGKTPHLIKQQVGGWDGLRIMSGIDQNFMWLLYRSFWFGFIKGRSVAPPLNLLDARELVEPLMYPGPFPFLVEVHDPGASLVSRLTLTPSSLKLSWGFTERQSLLVVYIFVDSATRDIFHFFMGIAISLVRGCPSFTFDVGVRFDFRNYCIWALGVASVHAMFVFVVTAIFNFGVHFVGTTNFRDVGVCCQGR